MRRLLPWLVLALAGCASEPAPVREAPAPKPAPRPAATAPAAAPLPPLRPQMSPGLQTPPPSTRGPWTWPTKGEVIGRFDTATGSVGLSIAGTRGTPVVAAASGKVTYAGSGLRGYGKLVIIKHNDMLLTAYAHNDRILVTEGQWVKFGQEIAVMGDSDSNRVMLHFEIREKGRPVDPMKYLPGVERDGDDAGRRIR